MPIRRRLELTGAILLTAVAVAIGITMRPGNPPNNARQLASWVAAHPSDWNAASNLVEVALDSESPSRFELWRSTAHHVHMLAPQRSVARTAIVRSGFFHWYELAPADRAFVLGIAAALMSSEAGYASVYREVWDLTHDMAFLRRVNPGTTNSLSMLRDLAATHGQFAQYRSLREDVSRAYVRDFRAARDHVPPQDLVRLIPSNPTSDDEMLLREFLEALHRRPIDDRPADTQKIAEIAD
jgi:hypothetical protein